MEKLFKLNTGAKADIVFIRYGNNSYVAVVDETYIILKNLNDLDVTFNTDYCSLRYKRFKKIANQHGVTDIVINEDHIVLNSKIKVKADNYANFNYILTVISNIEASDYKHIGEINKDYLLNSMDYILPLMGNSFKKDDSSNRTVVNTVCIDCKDDVVNIVANDNYRMLWAKYHRGNTKDFTYVYKHRALPNNVYTLFEDDKVKLFKSKTELTNTIGNTTYTITDYLNILTDTVMYIITMENIELEPPDYKGILEGNTKVCSFGIYLEDITNFLNTAIKLNANSVAFKYKDGYIYIEFESYDKDNGSLEGEEYFDIHHINGDIKFLTKKPFYVNPKYLLCFIDVLKKLKQSTLVNIDILVDKDNDPFIMKIDTGNISYLIAGMHEYKYR